jgi:hypothetical protein
LFTGEVPIEGGQSDIVSELSGLARPNFINREYQPMTNTISEAEYMTGYSRPWLFLTLMLFSFAGCSPVMEVTRPTPTDLSQFQTGEPRDSVVGSLGNPITTYTEHDGASCDTYELYTKGYGAIAKVPVALAETAADVFTIGLAEFVLSRLRLSPEMKSIR